MKLWLIGIYPPETLTNGTVVIGGLENPVPVMKALVVEFALLTGSLEEGNGAATPVESGTVAVAFALLMGAPDDGTAVGSSSSPQSQGSVP